MSRRRRLLVAAALCGVVSHVAHAQDGRLQLVVTAQAGTLLVPGGYRFQIDDSGIAPRRWRYGVWPTVAVGGAAELTRVRRTLGLRADVVGSPWVVLRATSSTGALNRDGHNTFVAGLGSLVIAPPSLCTGSLCPRLRVGGGVAQYRVGALAYSGDVAYPVADARTTRGAEQLALGARWRVRRRLMTAEVSDVTTRGLSTWGYPSHLRRIHNVVATVGLSLHDVRP